MGTYTGSDKRLQYLFQNGGGGGGSTVSITPTLQSGTKIADFEIDGDAGELYAPAGGGGAGVVTPLWSGTLSTQGGTATLSQSYKNFNILIIKWSAQANTDYYQDNIVIPTAEIVNGQTYQFGASFIRSTSQLCQMAFSMSNDTTFTLDQIQISGAQAGVTVQAIYGVNVGGGGGNANIWTGTQTEYEAQASQIADDTVVLITDDEEQAQAVQVYSTAEQVIGTWIDGSTLYRRTITGLSLALNGTSWVNYAGVSNIKKLIHLDAYYEAADGRLLHCSIAEFQSLANGGLQLCATASTFNRTINVMTIEYTKTT